MTYNDVPVNRQVLKDVRGNLSFLAEFLDNYGPAQREDYEFALREASDLLDKIDEALAMSKMASPVKKSKRIPDGIRAIMRKNKLSDPSEIQKGMLASYHDSYDDGEGVVVDIKVTKVSGNSVWYTEDCYPEESPEESWSFRYDF